MVMRKAQISFQNNTIQMEIEGDNNRCETFVTTLQELEALVVDLSKIRLMSVLQQEKGVKIAEPAAQEFIAQNKRIRNILVPDVGEALKAT